MKKLSMIILSSILYSHGLEWWMTPFLSTYAPTDYSSHTLGLQKKVEKGYSSETYTFVQNNREALQTEISQGEGEHLDTLASFYEKMDEGYIKDKEKWKETLQKNYQNIFFIDNNLYASDEHVDYMLFNITYGLQKMTIQENQPITPIKLPSNFISKEECLAKGGKVWNSASEITYKGELIGKIIGLRCPCACLVE